MWRQIRCESKGKGSNGQKCAPFKAMFFLSIYQALEAKPLGKC